MPTSILDCGVRLDRHPKHSEEPEFARYRSGRHDRKP